MGVHVQSSQVIDRPIEEVFHFIVDNHVQNHPRWDSDIELWLESEEPIELGTIIQRRNHRSGEAVEGTMEVVEYEQNKSFATLIQDGPMNLHGRILFEPLTPQQTKVTTLIDFPDIDDLMDTTFLEARLEEVGQIRKRLIETEIKQD